MKHVASSLLNFSFFNGEGGGGDSLPMVNLAT
jgi:hypothetical protein